MPSSTPSSSNTDQDRICASLARSALFPHRMHRDVADGSHFPALLQLDLLRNQVLSSAAASGSGASISSVFPRHVVVVRNLADGGTQWNGEPDLAAGPAVKFDVIPDRLSIRCTSQCQEEFQEYPVTQRAFLQSVGGQHSRQPQGEEIVLCTNRILKSDAKDKKYQGVAKELPPKSYQAVEEVVAHQLVQVRHSDTGKDIAQVQIQAAKAAECYFSRHAYDAKTQVKKGSRLQTGYGWLPGFVQNWSMNKCLANVAMEQLVAQKQCESKQEAKQAVQEAMKKYNNGSSQ